jgi:hypothetical protein
MPNSARSPGVWRKGNDEDTERQPPVSEVPGGRHTDPRGVDLPARSRGLRCVECAIAAGRDRAGSRGAGLAGSAAAAPLLACLRQAKKILEGRASAIRDFRWWPAEQPEAGPRERPAARSEMRWFLQRRSCGRCPWLQALRGVLRRAKPWTLAHSTAGSIGFRRWTSNPASRICCGVRDIAVRATAPTPLSSP